ncbi:xylulose kinase [Chloroflexales bacterium ZM16-3]|nr:xylulose kinase [Chloroflexales bacterium ZM16-3]
MSDSPYILAIDLGTSGPKVALVATTGEVIGCAVETVDLLLLPGGGAEQRPADWWAAICAAARHLLAETPVAPERIVGVACTAQWSGTVAVDAAGAPLMNALIWMDSRGEPYVRRMTGGPLRIQGYGPGKLLRWLRLTGGAPTHAGKDSIAHILYLKHARPEIYRAAATFLEPKDYLNLVLTGRRAASFDSIILHWVTDNRDARHVRYDEGLLAMAGVAREKLPELLPGDSVLGPLMPGPAAELGVPAGLPVVVGTPDLHSAAIGAGSVDDYAANLYIGTSSWLTCHVPFKKADLLHNMASLPSPLPGRYLLINEQECAGACLRFLRDGLIFPDDALALGPGPADAYRRFDDLAAGVPAGSGGLIFTPWLYGERTPVEDHTLRGGLFNLSLDTTRAQVVRAVLEGVAYNSRWLLGHVERFIGRRLEAINIAGGGATSELWCQIYADVLDRPIRQVAAPVQINARGAGLLAAAALGHAPYVGLGSRVPVASTFTPNQRTRPVYDRLFREYLGLYRATRGMYARLNG